MARRPAPWLPTTLPRAAMLVTLCAAAWVADVCGHAWIDAPGRAADVLVADRDVMHVDDLPPGGLALLLTERDPGFFGHSGLDAAGPTVTSSVSRALFGAQGPLASGLAAVVVDRRLDKDTQLVLWLNTAPVRVADGRVVHGFDNAARVLFGAPVADLDLAELRELVARVDADAC